MPKLLYPGQIQLSDDNPQANGTADPGTSARAARADHVHPAAASGTTLVASGSLAGVASATIVNSGTLATDYAVLLLYAAWSGDTAADTVLLRLNNISTGTYLERAWSATTTPSFSSTSTGFGCGLTAVAAGGNGASVKATIFPRRVAHAGGVNVAMYEGQAHDHGNFASGAGSGSVPLAADVTRIDLVCSAGTGRLTGGYYRLLGIA